MHLSLVPLLLLLPSTLSSTLTPLRRSLTPGRPPPLRRSYDTHAYYVIETDSSVPQSRVAKDIHTLAEELQAEFVEPVGELDHTWLVRAPHDLVERGDGAWGAVMRPRSSVPVVVGRMVSGEGVGMKRDAVLERFELLRSRSLSSTATASTLSKRSLADSITSLTRQIPKRRVKRDLALLPNQGRAPPPIRPPPNAQPSAPVIPALISKVMTAFGIKDPMFPEQWHITNADIEENTVNVTGVWSQGIMGKGIRVCIVDDGLDMHSDDLKDNFFPEGSWDFNDHTLLPEPRLDDDQHGTRCAGEVAAVNNTVCGIGIAPLSSIAGVRILSGSITDADEAAALNYAYQSNDIYSCSWGPSDDGQQCEAPNSLIKKAMLNGVENGRGGKGSVFVFASGNGGALDDQCNFDGYTNSIYSITVGAIDRKGLHPYYSEACSAVMIVTYSSGSGDHIHTTDVGKDSCTDRHGGTSAAAPIAAGVFALVLEARPELTWRDLQHLCVQTAIPVNLHDPDWQMTPSGRQFNHNYGFGKLDAAGIVAAAKTHQLVKPQAWYESPIVPVNARVDKKGVKSTVQVTQQELSAANFERLEHVTVTLNAETVQRGQVEVILESPTGMKSILARPRRFDDSERGFKDWVFMSLKHWDENPVGTWTLTLFNRQEQPKNATFVDWKISFWGESIDPALATPYKLPHDDQIRLPVPPTVNNPNPGDPNDEPISANPQPTAGQDQGSEELGQGQGQGQGQGDQSQDAGAGVVVPNPTTAKSFARPTQHLPSDHGDAPGQSHPTFASGATDPPAADPTTPAPVPADSPTSTPAPVPGVAVSDANAGADADQPSPAASPAATELSGSQAADSTTVLDSVRSHTWSLGAAGLAIISVGGLTAFLLIRRAERSRSSGEGRDDRSKYDFEAVPGEEDDVPLNRMEGGGMRAASRVNLATPGGRGGETEGNATTRALYDAFGVQSDEDSDDEDGRGVGRGVDARPYRDNPSVANFSSTDLDPNRR